MYLSILELHLTNLATWGNSVISSSMKENRTQNQEVVFQFTLMIILITTPKRNYKFEKDLRD